MDWSDIIREVLRHRVHEDVIYRKDDVVTPVESLPIAYRSIGDNDGQIADYRIPVSAINGIREDLRSVHVKVYDTYYKVHWDYADPRRSPLSHLLLDAPHWIERFIDIAVNIGRERKW